jgi:hypothetical protein
MGEFFKGDMQEPVRQVSDIGKTAGSEVAVNNWTFAN